MKALVLKARETLAYEESYPEPEPKEGEVLVRVQRAGICRTDRKAYRAGQRDLAGGIVLGHEIAGWAGGRKVAVHPGIFCGECEDCREGHDESCGEMRIIGFHVNGGMAERIAVPRQNAVFLPDGYDLGLAALAEPLACAIHQAAQMGLSEKGRRVLILGCGALGVLAAFYLRSEGLEPAMADPNPAKLERALALGFRKAEEGAPYDAAIPCAPDSNALCEAIERVRARGKIGFFSGLAGDPVDPARLNEAHYKQLSLFGAYGCDIASFRAALALLPRLGLAEGLIHCVDLKEAAGVVSQLETERLFCQISL